MKNGVFILLVLLAAGLARAKVIYVDPPGDPSTAGITIDHNCVDLSAIPEIHLAPAASLRVLVRHASVGQGIDWGLECLAGNRPTNPSCSDYPPGLYDRSNWVFELRGGNSRAKVDDLVTQAATRTDDFDVFTMKFCYIDALGDNHPDWNYFRTKTEQLELDYPDKVFVWWTIPLTRDGMPGTDVFNALVRSYCRANGKVLFDIADIECHDPNGLKDTNAQGNEVICADYTKEIHAGHLNIPGRIRVASALWRLMARIGGRHKGTIQAAIRDANNGDTIILTRGTYTGPGNRDIDFLGKAITVRSTDPNDPNVVAETIIDANGTEATPHRGFYFHRAENEDSVLSGLTITNGGHGYINGAGICCQASSPTITNCTLVGNVSRGFSSHAGAHEGRGGAIYCEQSTARIAKCAMIQNTADFFGGAIYLSSSNPVITDCEVARNETGLDGGGIYCYKSNPELDNCTLTGNSANSAWGGGGGLCCGYYNSMPTLCNSVVAYNKAGWQGGGIRAKYITILNCKISANSARGGGGMFFDREGSQRIRNCLISGNAARGTGGAIDCQGSSAALSNCTIVGNRSGYPAGGFTHSGAPYMQPNSSTITNCILWGNTTENGARCSTDAPISFKGSQIAIFSSRSRLTVAYSNIHGGEDDVFLCSYGYPPRLVWANGNIDTDPCFADPGYWDPNGTPEDANDDFWVNGDYHLKSQAGRYDPNRQTWIIDDVTSPCIDAGDPMTPISYEAFPSGRRIKMGACADAMTPIVQEPFPNGGIVNMGAYGGTVEASKSYFGEPVCETIVAGDINGDCIVDFRDFSLLGLHWMEDNN